MSEDGPTGRDFGRLEAQVEALDSKFGRLAGDVKAEMQSMREQLETLTRLAERGRGAYWAAGLFAAALGALASSVVGLFKH